MTRVLTCLGMMSVLLLTFTVSSGLVSNGYHKGGSCELVAFTLRISCIYGSGIIETTVMNLHLLIIDDKNQVV